MTSLGNGFKACHGETRHHMTGGFCGAVLGACGAFLTILSPPAFAAPQCSISTTAVSFGSYNVFAALPNDNGVGAVSISCIGGGNPTFPVTLSTGQSGSYASRRMNSGANILTYNLYTTTARTTVWGDGTGGTSTMTAARNTTTNLSVYGRIPAGQDAEVGAYSDIITATVTF